MKASELIAILQKNPDLELGFVKITPYIASMTKEVKREIMLDFVKVFGRFNKKILGLNEIYLDHTSCNNTLDVSLYSYDTCKIVGHMVKKRLVSKPVVPVEMV